MLTPDIDAPRARGVMVMVLLWQLLVVLATSAVVGIYQPDQVAATATGGLAIWLPNVLIAALMSSSSPGNVVWYAMLRAVLVSISATLTFLAFTPTTHGYLIGACCGLFAITLLPLIYSYWLSRTHKLAAETD